MKRVKYIGPVLDFSGYGHASRNYVLALAKAGVSITVEAHNFEPRPVPVGSEEDRKLLTSLINNNDNNFDILITHLTPDLAAQYASKYHNKYSINYTVWETSKLHPHWVDCCNKSDEIWVPCQWNIDSFRDSGVVKPMFKIHHGIDVKSYDDLDISDFSIQGINKEETFVFLSVMQWSARKNPSGLLRAYYNAFGPEDNVKLVLKTYTHGGIDPREDSKNIAQLIKNIKADMQLSYYPKVVLLTEKLSDLDMKKLYAYADCYVSLTRGEGFGLTLFEAGLAGVPVIATGMGGNMEFMNEDSSYPVPFIWDYVSGMSTFNQWYLGNQQWASPSLIEAARLMKHVAGPGKEEALQKAQRLREDIINDFSWEKVAGQMISRLEQL